jgi:hypothetical protein
MITTEFYKGQGLGNQLWCYATARTVALDRGLGFGVTSPKNFLGTGFMDLDFGMPVAGITNRYAERRQLHPLNGADVGLADPEISRVPDCTKLDGTMQDERTIAHRKEEIRRWFKVRSEWDCFDYSADDICVINFRGSGYVAVKDFFLTRTYWKHAMANMRKINPAFRFVVITEDVRTAKKFFPNLEVAHFAIGKDYSIIKNARYLIASNSSFAQFPIWLSTELEYCIAPKYWARHNVSDGYWSLGCNIMTGVWYQDRTGALHDYDSCVAESAAYLERRPDIRAAGAEFKPSFVKSAKDTLLTFKAFRKETSTAKAALDLSIHLANKARSHAKTKAVRILAKLGLY